MITVILKRTNVRHESQLIAPFTSLSREIERSFTGVADSHVRLWNENIFERDIEYVIDRRSGINELRVMSIFFLHERERERERIRE